MKKYIVIPALYHKVETSIEKADKRCKFGIQCHTLLAAIIFKEVPLDECIKTLKNSGFKVVKIAKKPLYNRKVKRNKLWDRAKKIDKYSWDDKSKMIEKTTIDFPNERCS